MLEAFQQIVNFFYFVGASTIKMVLKIDRTFEEALRNETSPQYAVFRKDVIEAVCCSPHFGMSPVLTRIAHYPLIESDNKDETSILV